MNRIAAVFLVIVQSFFLFACNGNGANTAREDNTNLSDESRTELKVAFQGPNPTATELYINKFNETNTEYYAVFIDYGMDEDGLETLMRDISYGNAPDVVVSSGIMDTANGFADLYEFMDEDTEISREDFIPGLLPKLEDKGELHQIWDQFHIDTMFVPEEPFAEIDFMTLQEVAEQYRQLNSNGDLFSSWTDKMTFVNSVCVGMISRCVDFEQGSANFATEEFNYIYEMCNALPEEVDAERITFEEGIIKTYSIMAPETMEGITEAYGTNIRFFASADRAENYTGMWCRTGGRIMIPSRSENQAGAWEFIKTVLSYECQISNKEFFRSGLPVIAEAFNKVTSEMDNEEKKMLDKLMDSAVVINSNYLEIAHLINSYFEELFVAQKTEEQAASSLSNKVSLLLAERK